MKKTFNKFVYASLLALPSFAFAQSSLSPGSNSTFKDFIYNDIVGTIQILIPIMVAMAFVVFFWGLSKFILHSDSQADIQKGKNYMFWGIIVLFVLVSFRAIIAFITSDLGFGDGTVAPLLPTGGNSNANVTTNTNFTFPTAP